MIVADASAAADLLLGVGSPAADRLLGVVEDGEAIAVPHLLDVEVGQVVRRWVRAGDLDQGTARAMLEDLVALPLARYPHDWLVARAWDLRDNATFYDACYLALAEALEVPLVTGDVAMARVPGCLAEVEVVEVGR